MNSKENFLHKPEVRLGFLHRIGKDPYLDWMITVVVFFVLTVGLIYLGCNIYINMNNKLAGSVTDKIPTVQVPIDMVMLEKFVLKYESKAASVRETVRVPFEVSDPSL